MGSDKENAESHYKEASIIYRDIEDFDLGKELEKLKEENKILLNHICCLEGDVEKLAAALLKLKSLQDNLTKNISSLYMTAKTEIDRKDRIIADLRTQLDDITFRRIGIMHQKRKPDEVLEANSKKAKYQESEDCANQQTRLKTNDDVIVIEEDAGRTGSSKKLVERNISTSDERSRNRNTREVYEQRSRHEEFDKNQDHDRSYREYRNRSKSRDRRKQYDDDHVYYSRDEEFHNRGIGHRYNNFESNRYHRTDYGENKRRNYRSEQNTRCRQNRNTDEDEFYHSRREIHSENDAVNIQNEVSGKNEHTKTLVHDPSPDKPKHEDKQATKSVRKKLRVIHKLEKERNRKQPNPRSTISSENTPSSSSKKVKRPSIEKIGNIFSDGIHDIMDTVLQEIHDILPSEKKTPNQCHETEKRSTEKNIANAKKTKEAAEADQEIQIDGHSNSKNFDYSSWESGTVRDNIMRQSDMESLLKQTLTISHSGNKNKHNLRDEKGPLDMKDIKSRDILEDGRSDDESLCFDSKTGFIDIAKEIKEERNKEKVNSQHNIKRERTDKENTDKIEDDEPGRKSSTNTNSVGKNNTIPRMDPSYKIPKKDPKSLKDDSPDKYNPLGKCSAHETSRRSIEKNDKRPGRERSRDHRSSNRSRSEGRPRSKSEGRRRSRSRPNHKRHDDKYRGRSNARNKTSRSRSRSIEAHDRRKYNWSRSETVASERSETSRSITKSDREASRCRSLTPMSYGDWILNDYNNANTRGWLGSPDDHKETYHKDENTSGMDPHTSETGATGESNIQEDEGQIQMHSRKTRLSVGDGNMDTNSPIVSSQNMIVHTHSSSNQQGTNEVNISGNQRPSEETAIPEMQKNTPPMKWKIKKIEEFVQYNAAACSSSYQHGNNQPNQQENKTNISFKLQGEKSNYETLRISEHNLLNKEPIQASESNTRVVENCRQLTLKEMGITARLSEQDPLRQIIAKDTLDEEQKIIQSDEEVCPSESGESRSIAEEENERKFINNRNNQDTIIARNVELEGPLLDTKSTGSEKVTKIIETITMKRKSRNKREKKIDSTIRWDESEQLATHAYNKNSPVDSSEKWNTGTKTQIDNVEMGDESPPFFLPEIFVPQRTYPENLYNYDKENKWIPALAIVGVDTADSPELKSSKDSKCETPIRNTGSEGQNLQSKDESLQSSDIDIETLDENSSEDSARLVGASQPQNEEKCEPNVKSRVDLSLPILSQSTSPEKLMKPTSTSITPISTPKKQINREQRNKTKPIAEEERKRKLETVINNLSKRKSSEAVDTTVGEKITSLDRLDSEVVNVESQERNLVSEARRTVKKENISKDTIEEAPIRKLDSDLDKNIAKAADESAKNPSEASGASGTAENKKVPNKKSIRKLDKNSDLKKIVAEAIYESAENPSEASQASGIVENKKVPKNIRETPIRKLGKNSALKKIIAEAVDKSAENPSDASEASGRVENKKVPKNIRETPIRNLDKKSALKKIIAEAVDESAENPSDASEASDRVENKKVSKETPIRKLDKSSALKKIIAEAVDESADNTSEVSEASGRVENKKVSKETPIRELDKSSALKKIIAEAVDESADNTSEVSEASGRVENKKVSKETPIRELDKSSALKKIIAEAVDESADNISEVSEASGRVENKKVPKNIRETPIRNLDKKSALKKIIAEAVDESAENPSDASEASGRVENKKASKETPIGKLDKSSALKKIIAEAVDESADNASEVSEASGRVENKKVSKETPIRKLDKSSALKKIIAEAVDESADNTSEVSEASGRVENKKVSKETPIRELDKSSALKKIIAEAVDESADNISEVSEASGRVENKKVPKNIRETPIRNLDKKSALKKIIAEAVDESAENPSDASEASGRVENKKVSKETPIGKLDKSSALKKIIAEAVDESADNASEVSEASGRVENKKVSKEIPIRKLDKNSALKKIIAEAVDEAAEKTSEASQASSRVENKKISKNIKATSIRKYDKNSALKKIIAEAVDESAEKTSEASQASGTVENKKISKNIKATYIRKYDKNSALKKIIAEAVDESAENPSEASEASGTLKNKKVFKSMAKNPISSEESMTQTASKQCTPNQNQQPIRKRITPIPVKDSPICSFENILVKNQSPFSKDTVIQVSPLTLTHEGEIPVLHLDENHFCNLRADGQKAMDSNIMNLLDQMNISNMDCDITKFGSANERTEGAATSSGTPANFENAIQTSSKEVNNDAPPSGQNTPFVRRRRRCRLVVLK